MRNLTTLLLLLSAAASADIIKVGTVCAGGCDYANSDLYAALNAAKLGDTVVLSAGETFQANYFLFAKHASRGNGEEWLTITSSRANELPPTGTRVGPQHAPLMPKIVTPSTDPALTWEYGFGPITSVNASTGAITINTGQIYGPSDIVVGDRVTIRHLGNNDAIAPFANNTPYFVVSRAGAVLQLSTTRGGAPMAPITYSPPGGDWSRVVVTKVDPIHHVRLRGLEITTDGGGGLVYSLLRFGNMQEVSYESLPYAIEVAHCYLHGQPLDATEGPRNAIMFAGSIDIHDSYIADIKDTGGDANGISSFVAPGPIRVANNYIEASTINFILGGGSAQIIGMVNGERGGLFERNYLTKQGAWRYREAADGVSGTPPAGNCIEDEFYKYTNISQGWRCTAAGTWERRDDLLASRVRKYHVKNVFELKSAKNMAIRGNILEKSWIDGQIGDSILMQTIDRTEWFSPWTEFADIAFRNNISRKTSNGLTLFTIDQSQPNKNRRVILSNNLFHDLGVAGGVGDMLRVEWGQQDLVFEHNTFAGRAGYRGFPLFIDADNAGGVKGQRYLLRDSIMGNGPSSFNMNCGIWADRLDASIISRVLMWNPNSNGISNMTGACSEYLTSLSGAAADGLFQSEAGKDFRVQSSSPAYRAASDGKDLGADMLELTAATSNVETGAPSFASQWNLRIEAGSSKAVISWRRPAGTTCTVRLYTDAARTTLHADTDTSPEQADSRSGSVVNTDRQVHFVAGVSSALTPQTRHWGVLACGSQELPFVFLTHAPGAAGESQIQFSSARAVRYAASPAMTGAVTLSAAATHRIPMGASATVYFQEGTTGPLLVFINP